MFNPWSIPNPAETHNVWMNYFAPNQLVPPTPYQQLAALTQAFQSHCQSDLQQGSDVFNQTQIEDLARSFALDPILSTLPSNAQIAQTNQISKWLTNWQSQASWNPLSSNLPALGITREYQEDWTKWLKLQQRFQLDFSAYVRLFLPFSQNVSAKYSEILANAASTENFDALCRKWIEVCEAEFQKIAITPEFSRIFGKLVNSSIRLQQHLNRMQDKFSQLQGHPSRAEVNEVHQKNSKASADIEAMQQEIEALKQQIESLKNPKSNASGNMT